MQSRHRTLLFILILALPVAASPRGGAERALSQAPAVSAFGSREATSIARDGDEGFMIWRDHRPGGFRVAIYGSRLDASDRILDPAGILIDEGFGEQWRVVKVLPFHGAWLAVWIDAHGARARVIDRNGAFVSTSVALGAITHVSRGDAAGNGETALVSFSNAVTGTLVLVDANLRIIKTWSERDLGVEYPRLLADGDGYSITGRRRYPRDNEGVAFRVSASGDVEEAVPAIRRGTYTGVDYADVTHDYEFVIIRRQNADGGNVRPSIVVAPYSHFARGATLFSEGGGTVRVFWFESRNAEGPFTLHAARVDASDVVSEPIRVGTYTTKFEIRQTDSGYRLLEGDKLVTDLSRELRVVNSFAQTRIQSPPQQFHVAAVRDGAADLVAFIQDDGMRMPRVMVGRRGLAPRALIDTGRAQFSPAIASSGRTAMVTWFELIGTDWWLFALPVSLEGEALQSEAVRVGTAGWRTPYRNWRYEQDEIFYNAPAAIVWTGSAYLAAWSNGVVRTARLLEDGNLIDMTPRTPIPQTPEGQFQPVLARNGDLVVLAWVEGSLLFSCSISCSNAPSTIRAARLDSEGNAIDPDGFDAGAAPYSADVDVAINGDVALLVWTTHTGPRSGVNARGVQLRGSSPNAQPFALAVTSGLAWLPSVAAHQDGFIVSWLGGPIEYDEPFQSLLAMTISRRGEQSSPAVLAPLSRHAEFPVAWTLPDGNAAVAYERTGVDTGLVPRLFYIPIDSNMPIRRRAGGR